MYMHVLHINISDVYIFICAVYTSKPNENCVYVFTLNELPFWISVGLKNITHNFLFGDEK